MLHYIFVNDTGNISDNLTVRLIIFFGILHEDSYTISTSTGQKNETNVIATDLLSFRIKISRSGLWPTVLFVEQRSNQTVLPGLTFYHCLKYEVFVTLGNNGFLRNISTNSAAANGVVQFHNIGSSLRAWQFPYRQWHIPEFLVNGYTCLRHPDLLIIKKNIAGIVVTLLKCVS